MAHSNSAASNGTAGRDDDDVELDKRNALLYNALMKEERSKLVELYCRRREQYPDGPLHVITIHGDTVLHMAAHTAKAGLVIQLLEMLPQYEYFKLTHQNAAGNTILHEAAAFDKLVPAAKRMLEMAPARLLSIRNHSGETPLFSAARYGQIEMFAFLHMEVGDQNIGISEAERKTFYQNQNNTTVLHTAVILGHFDLALTIAKECEYLVAQRDETGMTALQYLACNSTIFETKSAGFLQRIINHYGWVWNVALLEAIGKLEMLKYESAKKLASFLVEKDNTSWKQTYPLEAPQSDTQINGGPSISSSSSNNISVNVEIEGENNNTETPLFLAIKAGCVDIVEMILQFYPQAVEHVDGNGCTILHIVIKYRQLWVFDVLHQVGIPWRRLVVQRDRDLNTILHMVGQDSISELVQGNHMVQLHDEVLLFKNVQKICSSCSVDTSLCRNREGKTAKEIFAKNKEELRTKAVEWVKFIIESTTWLGVFIAAVAFAAVYTLPGGLNQNTGIPMFLNHHFFIVFIISDVLCFSFFCFSKALLISIYTSPFRFKDFEFSIPARIALAVKFNLYGMTMLALAFAATIILIAQTKKEKTIRIRLNTIGFLPFIVLSLSFMPVYLYFWRSFISMYTTPVRGPRYTSFSFRSCIRKFATPSLSNPTPAQQTTPSIV